MTIQQHALLVRVRISKFSNSVTDKELSANLCQDKQARSDLVRVRKTLIDSPAVKKLATLSGHIRNKIVGKYTVPWDEDGARLLPVSVIDQFEADMRKASDEWEALVRELINDYDNAVLAARQHLGQVFKEEDYPTRDEVEAKYNLEKTYTNLPDSGDLRVALPAAQVEDLRKQIKQDVEGRVQEAARRVQEKVIDVLTHLAERLESFGRDENGKAVGVFRDSTVENLNELAQVLPALNITKDPTMTAATQEILAKLKGLDPKVLRQDASKRTEVAQTARKITGMLEGLYGTGGSSKAA